MIRRRPPRPARRSASTALLALVAAGVCACSTETKLDPFGRPYASENALPEAELRTCAPREVERRARLLSGTRPLYPALEDLRGRSGSAVVVFDVLPDGSARSVAARTENQWFADHAVIAMRDWRFDPALAEGRPVTVRCTLAFDFLTWREKERRELEALKAQQAESAPR